VLPRSALGPDCVKTRMLGFSGAAGWLMKPKDPLFSDVTKERFDALRAHILRLEQEAEAERK
jgi:hypothetical protein